MGALLRAVPTLPVQHDRGLASSDSPVATTGAWARRPHSSVCERCAVFAGAYSPSKTGVKRPYGPPYSSVLPSHCAMTAAISMLFFSFIITWLLPLMPSSASRMKVGCAPACLRYFTVQ